jgi:hypothetical protein
MITQVPTLFSVQGTEYTFGTCVPHTTITDRGSSHMFGNKKDLDLCEKILIAVQNQQFYVKNCNVYYTNIDFSIKDISI